MAGNMDDSINTISLFLLLPGITFLFLIFLFTLSLFLGNYDNIHNLQFIFIA
jgi:hypothetical protein